MAPDDSRGVALIVALWGIVLLAFLAASFSGSTRTGANLVRNLVQNAQAEALADAGLNRAVLALERPIDEGGIRVDGTPYAWSFADGEVRLWVQDEGGKIDLNAASTELLRDLFVAVGVEPEDSQALADAVADFRDSDDDRRPYGAEDADYERAGLASEAKDRPFERVEEAQQVIGMTALVYRRVAPLLTVWSEQAEPDGEVAPAEIRAILARESGEVPTEDEPSSEAAEDAGELPADSPAPLAALREGGSEARSGLDVYTVHSEGLTKDGSVFVREAVVAFPGDERRPYSVLDWRQGKRVLFRVMGASDQGDELRAPLAGTAGGEM